VTTNPTPLSPPSQRSVDSLARGRLEHLRSLIGRQDAETAGLSFEGMSPRRSPRSPNPVLGPAHVAPMPLGRPTRRIAPSASRYCHGSWVVGATDPRDPPEHVRNPEADDNSVDAHHCGLRNVKVGHVARPMYSTRSSGGIARRATAPRSGSPTATGSRLTARPALSGALRSPTA
jgi:hypothetical protein